MSIISSSDSLSNTVPSILVDFHGGAEQSAKRKAYFEELDRRISAVFQSVLPKDKQTLGEAFIKGLTLRAEEEQTKFFCKSNPTERYVQLLFLKAFCSEELHKELNSKCIFEIFHWHQPSLGSFTQDIQTEMDIRGIEQDERSKLNQILKNEFSHALKAFTKGTPDDQINLIMFIDGLKPYFISGLYELLSDATPKQLCWILSCFSPVSRDFDKPGISEIDFIANMITYLIENQKDKFKEFIQICPTRILTNCLHALSFRTPETPALATLIEELRMCKVLEKVLSETHSHKGYFYFSYMGLSSSELLDSMLLAEGAKVKQAQLIFSELFSNFRNNNSPLELILDCLNSLPNKSLATKEIALACWQGMLSTITPPLSEDVFDFGDEEAAKQRDEENLRSHFEAWVKNLWQMINGLSAEMKPLMLEALSDEALLKLTEHYDLCKKVLDTIREKVAFEKASEYFIKDTNTLPADIVNCVLKEFIYGPLSQAHFEQTKDVLSELNPDWPNEIATHLKGYIVP